MGDRLKGRNAVVTGAGRGIGREIALALAREGAKVVVNDLGGTVAGTEGTATPADEVVAEIKKLGVDAVANYESVADFAAAERMIRACVDNFGRIDILVNVAGILRDRMLFNMSEEEWDAVLAVHLKGTFNTTRHASRLMREQRYGRIINTTSDAWRGTVGHANYGAAKGGIVSFSYAVAREMGRYGVTCNVICPMAATRMTLSDEVKEGFKKRLEAGLVTQERYDEIMSIPPPEFVPPIAVYLATDHAADINGAVLGCGGGRVALYSEPIEIRGIYKDHQKEGPWSLDELISLVPKTLLVGYANPAPAEAKE
ncbi:MAG: SDR family NAD(P)-dependent oxidoreductase [Dehalococcoidia bacterium]